MEDHLDDIEDLYKTAPDNDLTTNGKRKNKLIPRVRKIRSHKEDSKIIEDIVADSIIPGTQKIYFKTWGCSHNNSDSEYMAGLLASYGYHIVDDADEADLWVLNSCTVKGPAEDHLRNAVNAGREVGKKVVVAGCVSQAAPRTPYLEGLSLIGVQQIDRVVDVVEETLKGHSVRLLSQKKTNGKKAGGASLQLPKIRKNPLIEIIPINTGCLNQCTYCKTKHARGELGSYPIEEIVLRAKEAFTEGVCEIWLTSEDLGAYGYDIGTSLPELLYQLVEVIPANCRLRLGMTNPPYILQHLDAMAEILSHPHVYSFLHVPVQAGSDGVLADMKREYSNADFRLVVDFLREKVPGITIATDFICGFPTETDDDFQASLDLINEYKFPSVFINQFYPRPGTPAARMPRIPSQEVKKRTKRMTEAFHAYRPYDHKVGQTFDVLVTEVSHDSRFYVGHNKFYDQVLVPKNEELLGKMVEVIITESGKHYMMGQPTGSLVKPLTSVSESLLAPTSPSSKSSSTASLLPALSNKNSGSTQSTKENSQIKAQSSVSSGDFKPLDGSTTRDFSTMWLYASVALVILSVILKMYTLSPWYSNK